VFEQRIEAAASKIQNRPLHRYAPSEFVTGFW